MSTIKFNPAEKFYFHHGMSKRISETGASWPHYHSLYEIYFLEEGNCTSPKKVQKNVKENKYSPKNSFLQTFR